MLYYRFNDQLVDDFSSDEYSIGTYRRKNLGNDYFKDNFKSIESKNTYEINNMYLGINDYYYSNVFDDYGLLAYMEFRLIRDNEFITPPNTGI